MPEEAVAAIFEDCVKVTDVGCEALAKNCPSLTNVVSSRCGNVTAVGFEALAMNCTALTTIYLIGAARSRMRASRPLPRIAHH